MPKDLVKHDWQSEAVDARLWSARPDGAVQCHLSPRNCVIRDGYSGFCRVRVNRGGKLRTLNYGKSVAMTQETIETEAVFHYMPGTPILSMGNVGCMMNCDYCHNWATSQAVHVTDEIVHTYTSEQVVAEALARGIQVLSWTYNDPVVWHEFVLDTAALAREHGLVNLFKSAFFISLEGATELADVIDIFSISLKSMDPKFYKRVTKGRLEPVLEATEYVFRRGRHVEVSNLVVTDSNDTPEDAEKIAKWVTTSLSPETPLHFVRFHPDYKYTHVGRTPIPRLEAARQIAMEVGIQNCYLGNVYDNDAMHSYCSGCGATLVRRSGIVADPLGLNADSTCKNCGQSQPFKLSTGRGATPLKIEEVAPDRVKHIRHLWRGDVKAVHIEAVNNEGTPRNLRVRTHGGSHDGEVVREIPVLANSQFRVICCKSVADDEGVVIEHPDTMDIRCYEVYDRAHFPTLTVNDTSPDSDAVPQPVFMGMPTSGGAR